MILIDAYSTLYTRLTGDTTLVGLLGGKHVYDNFASSNQRGPYIVVNFGDARADDAFQSDQHEVEIRVSLFVPNRNSSTATSSAIAVRIYGDASSYNSFQPTFGLHRWAPTPTTQWRFAGALVNRASREEHEEGWYHWIDTYAVRMYRIYDPGDPAP